MDTIEKINIILSTNKGLTDLLSDGEDGIFYYESPDGGSYPILVYNEISNTPALFGDNQEEFKSSTIQISILTADGEYFNIEKLVNEIMKENGFRRQYSTNIIENNIKIRVIRYNILEV